MPCDYFSGEVTAVARDLIGRRLVVSGPEQSIAGVIIETEAYGGANDPASHAAFRPGGRAAAMVGPPGVVYVYAAYGMYPCFNIVTGAEGVPSAVLVRGVWLDGDTTPTSGPGRLTRAMGITGLDHAATVGGERFNVSVTRQALDISVTKRVGITRGVELPWRYVGMAAKAATG
ncbi:MAG: DNA-3-methyladenine glycosylase [Thermomicrobiales bacterium]